MRGGPSARRRKRGSFSSRHDSICRAQECRQAKVNQIHIGQRQNHIGTQHDAAVQQVVDDVGERRVGGRNQAGGVGARLRDRRQRTWRRGGGLRPARGGGGGGRPP